MDSGWGRRLAIHARRVHYRFIVHEYWEEVFLVSGDLVVGNDANGNGGKSFPPNTYACRPLGAYHGPFKSNSGCVLSPGLTVTPVS
ncbi:MAG: hypothetical protein WAN52_01750 [Pseudolabrys sp.]